MKIDLIPVQYGCRRSVTVLVIDGFCRGKMKKLDGLSLGAGVSIETDGAQRAAPISRRGEPDVVVGNRW